MPVTLTINDNPVSVPEGSSVLDAINFSGTTITPMLGPLRASRS